MKIFIFYFSGTGNTEKVARLYSEALEKEGAEVSLGALPDIESKLPELELNGYDVLGFGYPIHSFNAPENVLRLAKKLPRLDSAKRAFIFKSSGEPVRMSDVSSLKLIKLLRKRNINVLNEYQYCMPYNIIFRHSDEMAYRMWETAKKLVPADCREIMSGKPHSVKRMFMGGAFAKVLRIEHWGAHVIGRNFKVTRDCVKCGLCVKDCPANNIRITEKGKIKFGGHCLICMRCAFSCPKDAIKPGILNGWKVNGAYSFAMPSPEESAKPYKHANYCKKAYKRYFAAAENKISEYEKTQP